MRETAADLHALCEMAQLYAPTTEEPFDQQIMGNIANNVDQQAVGGSRNRGQAGKEGPEQKGAAKVARPDLHYILEQVENVYEIGDLKRAACSLSEI